MWGLVLSALTIAVSFLTESGREDRMNSRQGGGGGGGRAAAASRGWLSLANGISRDALTSRLLSDRVFVSGALLGLGVSLFWASVSKQFKVGERSKQLVRAWWYWEKPEQVPFRVPVSLLQQATLPASSATITTTTELVRTPFLQRNGHGTIREVVSPASASTYNLRVVTLVIGPGRELSPSRSNGVEFYYVLTGSGAVSQQGIAATSQIRAGDCFVVDVGQMRWIANLNAVTEDLVLLRASDGGTSGCGFGMQDIIRLDPNRRAATTIDAIKDSVRHMHSLARDYVNGAAE